MSTTILAIGFLVFISHFLSLFFRRTNIPDVLILMLLGIVLGPVLNLVQPADFGKVGSIIATIALVVILFESGTSLRLDVMQRALAATGQLTFISFVLTAAIVAGTSFFLLGLQPLPACLLGLILGGTSSAVVIPMVESLKPGEKAGTVLVLESALTDVLSIVGVVAMIQVITGGDVHAGKLVGSVLASLIFAAILGVLGGAGWLMILGRVRGIPNTISSTIAHAFLVYGTAEFLGFSGAIAAMALGITLTNYEAMGLRRIPQLKASVVALTPSDLDFFKEAVFLLKTYFFVYLGISIQFGGWTVIAIASCMVLAVFLMRIAVVRTALKHPDYPLRDASLASMLAPKGLAAAVLATVPLQYGIAGAEVIRDTAYMVVLVSITVCAVLVALLPTRWMQRAYGMLLGKAVPPSN